MSSADAPGMERVRRCCTRTVLVRVRPRSDVDGTQQGRAASDRLQADCCPARDVRRWDWFVEMYARAEGP